MLWRMDDIIGISLFNSRSAVHHNNAGSILGSKSKIMSDHQDRRFPGHGHLHHKIHYHMCILII